MTIAANPLQVLVLQTAVPAYVKQAMEDILDKRLLGDVSVTLFCRALTEESTQFQEIPWISELLAHDEARGVFGHLRSLRRRKFDVIVVFLTRDPSYWKMKCFAFLCRGRHVLVFNEHLGCFFYTHRLFAGFLWARYREWKLRAKQKLGYALGTPQGMMSEISSPGLAILRPVHLTLKLLIFPLRWIYLLAWSCSMQYKREKYLQRHSHNLKFDADSR